jgi:hypothetical protein
VPTARKGKLEGLQIQARPPAGGGADAELILRDPGGVSILCDYTRPKRPLQQPRATLRFEAALPDWSDQAYSAEILIEFIM